MAKITKTKSGNYTMRVVVGHDQNGRPIQKRFTHYDKAKLRFIAAEYEDSHRNTIRRITVEDAIMAFLASRRAVLSPSTLKGYNSCANVIKCEFGRFCALYVDEVTQADVQAIINEMVLSGKKPKTVKNLHGFLSSVFKFAGVPLPSAALPQSVKPNITIPEADEMKDLLSKAAGTRLEIPLALAAMGLRRSEICALTLDDLSGNVLHIHKSAVYGPDKQVHIKTTKNYSSDRFIVIPEPLADKIRTAGIIWDASPIALSSCFDKFVKKHGHEHYRLHDMRHFFASYCHNVLKMSDKQIQAITGHKTSETLHRVYLHSLNQDQVNQEVATNMAQFMV
ncbi:MAG: site-specific integrase [Lachnospiraceae bacterium]|nr:site-specific integrase [Lachnospiraceae bacterium]